MKNYKVVTLNQGQQVRKIANDKKVGCARFQTALDDGSFARFVEGLKIDPETPEISAIEIIAPAGARIHTLRIRYQQDREWQEAVTAAGPDTPSHYSVRKVGGFYVPAGTGEVEEDLILLNYTDGSGNWEKALAWGAEKKLEKTAPREVFAIGEQHPKLHEELGQNPMYLVATTPCTFGGNQQACYVWWDDAERDANVSWTRYFNDRGAWFLFHKPSVIKTKAL